MARYIDADKLSSKVLDVWKKFEKQGKNCYVFADIFTPLIVSTPTEDVAPIVRGKWIYEEIGIRTIAIKCSNCGRILHSGNNYTKEEFTKHINDLLKEKNIELDKYCSNCGAKMEGVEE